MGDEIPPSLLGDIHRTRHDYRCSAGKERGKKEGGAPALTRLTSRLVALGRLLIRQGRGLAVVGAYRTQGKGPHTNPWSMVLCSARDKGGALSLAPVHSDRVERLLLVGKIVVHAGHPEVMLILNADPPFCRFHLILSVED